MATVKEWFNQKFNEWEKRQGGRQSYYAFARYLEVGQSVLSQWMIGSAVPDGEDLAAVAAKLGPEIYDVAGLPRPNADTQRLMVSFANLPPDIRDNLSMAVAEANQALKQENLRADAADARKLVIAILEKWGFRYTR